MEEEDFYEEDDEITVEFLIDEPPDIDLLWMPKMEFDLDEYIQKLYKKIKKCKNKGELIPLLYQTYGYISNHAVLEHKLRVLQADAKDLELMVQVFKQEGILDQ